MNTFFLNPCGKKLVNTQIEYTSLDDWTISLGLNIINLNISYLHSEKKLYDKKLSIDSIRIGSEKIDYRSELENAFAYSKKQPFSENKIGFADFNFIEPISFDFGDQPESNLPILDLGNLRLGVSYNWVNYDNIDDECIGVDISNIFENGLYLTGSIYSSDKISAATLAGNYDSIKANYSKGEFEKSINEYVDSEYFYLNSKVVDQISVSYETSVVEYYNSGSTPALVEVENNKVQIGYDFTDIILNYIPDELANPDLFDEIILGISYTF